MLGTLSQSSQSRRKALQTRLYTKIYMKTATIVNYIAAAAVGGLAVAMLVTNPQQSDYEAYAVQQLTAYLKSEVCTQVPKAFETFVRRNCSRLVDSSRSQMQQIIAHTTRRQNFVLFSIYHTDLLISPLIPAYNFKTVGIFANFYTYAAEQQ